MNKNCLIFFLKYPEEGKVKTRLSETIGTTQATELYKYFVADILETINHIDSDIVICFAPLEKENEMKNLLGFNFLFSPQIGNSLGERMSNSFSEAFNMNYEKVVLIGSDMPQLKEEIIEEAFKGLNSKKVVLGPTKDGGYYLIGFKKHTFQENTFEGIKWSSDSVLKDTIQKIGEGNFQVSLLPELTDIDNFDDLNEFYSNRKNKKLKTYKYLEAKEII
jgi:uncharacterized protein